MIMVQDRLRNKKMLIYIWFILKLETLIKHVHLDPILLKIDS